MRIDSPVIAAGTRITDLLILNFYWLIGCLPLVTIGVSTIAAYTVTLKMVDDCEDYSMTAQFWKAYVKNLKHGIPLSLVLLAACGSIWMDVKMIEDHTGDKSGLLTAGILLLLLVLIHFLYVFPLEARYQNRLMAGIANARGIFLSYLRRSLILTGILLAEFLLVTQLKTPLRSFSAFFLPILMIYTVSKAVHPIFRELEQAAGKGANNLQGKPMQVPPYRNLFAELGYDPAEIKARTEGIFEALFYGGEGVQLYHPAGADMAYFEDTGNHDVRTEGMSYAMMMCVQMDRQAEFDRLWRWAKAYMRIAEGPNAGYFAWSCGLDGSKNAYDSAPDGEEYFAMALFFAAHRWEDGKGASSYEAEARHLLHTCLHKGEDGLGGRSMWDIGNYLIRFTPELDFSDPSYHLPHFYELFALWADEDDRPFWKKAAEASRDYLVKACHPVTGLCAEYADMEGRPQKTDPHQFGGRHDWYYSDAYRTILNIALDAVWFGSTPWAVEEANRLQSFFYRIVPDNAVYEVDGTILPLPALHPTAIIATNAAASLVADGPWAEACARRFWETPLRTGDRRYYDNCLSFFAFLALGGNYRIY